MKKPNPRTIALILAILSVWSFLAPFLAERLIVERPFDRADVIFVLAGSSTYLERTQKAAQLFQKHVAHKILLTDDGLQAGWSQEEQRNPKFVELARQQLLAHGVPDRAIEILSPEVFGTIMEARLLAKKAAENRWKYLLIVTSPYHTRRALRTFETVFSGSGVKTKIGIVSPGPGQQSPSALYWWITRSGWRHVGGEYVKSVYYNVNYHLGGVRAD